MTRVKDYLAERAELLAWAREEAQTFLAAHALTVDGGTMELLAMKIAGAYLVGANAALLDETRRTQDRLRLAQLPASTPDGAAPASGTGTGSHRRGC